VYIVRVIGHAHTLHFAERNGVVASGQGVFAIAVEGSAVVAAHRDISRRENAVRVSQVAVGPTHETAVAGGQLAQQTARERAVGKGRVAVVDARKAAIGTIAFQRARDSARNGQVPDGGVLDISERRAVLVASADVNG
jgi:hypothetical protein